MTLSKTAKNVAALLASTATYMRDSDYDAFTLRQREIWNEIEAQGARVKSGVLARLRERLPVAS